MKTLKTILKQDPIYLNNWKHKVDVIGDFEDIYMTNDEYIAKEAPYQNKELWEEKKIEMAEAITKFEDINILFAFYGYEDYEGEAFILYENGGKLYEVNGGHCSCYGLEGQWEPEETSLKALEHRILKGKLGEDYYSGSAFKTELVEFLGIK